jgi:hypothetical protein
MLCKKQLFPTSFTSFRTYLVTITVPRAINAKLTMIPPGSLVKMTNKAWEKGASIMIKSLRQEIENKGCVESSRFLDALKEFAGENECRGLMISGMPPSPASAILINSILYGTGYGCYSNPYTQNPFIVDSMDFSKALIPHTDQPGDERLDAFALNAEEANGTVPTYFISPYVIVKSGELSDRQKDILSQPSFLFSNHNGQEEKPFSIISRKEGKLRINFDCDIRGFDCDFSLNPYTKDEIAEAVNALNGLLYEMVTNQEGDVVSLSTGQAVVAKNDLHGRPDFPDHTQRRVLTRTYSEKMEDVPLVLRPQSSPCNTAQAKKVNVDIDSKINSK